MIHAAVQLDRPGFRLDLDIQTGDGITGVFGASGAGKTTLINLIAGLERPDRGAITLDGVTLFDHARGINVPIHRRRIGVVFQEHRLFPHYSVEGNLRYARRSGAADVSKVADLLELSPLLRKRIHQLSGGERQRTALGRALLSAPRLLLLDEPLASLDLRLRRQILPYLRRIRDELRIPMLYVSHDLTEVLQLTDDLLVIERGRVLGHGRYTDVIHDDAVLAAVHDRGMDNVLAARVIAHHAEDGASLLELCPKPGVDPGKAPPARLTAPLVPASVGDTILIAVRPGDISLATDRVPGVSIQNQVPGTITRCSTHDRTVLVQVSLGPTVLAEVSKRSAAALNLAPGHPIVCLIKSQSIQHNGRS